MIIETGNLNDFCEIDKLRIQVEIGFVNKPNRHQRHYFIYQNYDRLRYLSS